MVFGELGVLEEPGRVQLSRFVELVVQFLQTVLDDPQNFGFLWRYDDQLADQARSVFSDYVRPSAESLRAQIPIISETQLETHGLDGRPLAFKFRVLAAVSNSWDRFRGKFSVEKWLKKIIDAIDAILDSLISAAGGVGSLLKEFKDALRALINDD